MVYGCAFGQNFGGEKNIPSLLAGFLAKPPSEFALQARDKFGLGSKYFVAMLNFVGSTVIERCLEIGYF